MQIQHAESGDLDGIRDLLEAVNLPHRDLTPSHPEDFLLCEDGERLLGTVGLEPYGEVALLRSLAVVPQHRNEGLGFRLLDEVEQYARQIGTQELYLLTTTASEYFRRHGYEIIERDDLPPTIRETEEATRLCPSTATCMKKHLGASEQESE